MVEIQSFTENPEDIFDYTPWTLQVTRSPNEEEVVNVVQWRRHNMGFIELKASTTAN